MTLSPKEIERRAKQRYARIVRQRRDPRFQRVLGRFLGAGLLSTNLPVAAHREPIHVADALWAGELEPRILELLPALVVKKPAFFTDLTTLPGDLDQTVRALKRNEVPSEFRGIPGHDVQRWVPRIGRKALPSRLKSFRLTAEDLQLLAQLRQDLGTTETDVLRRALRELAGSLLVRS